MLQTGPGCHFCHKPEDTPPLTKYKACVCATHANMVACVDRTSGHAAWSPPCLLPRQRLPAEAGLVLVALAKLLAPADSAQSIKAILLRPLLSNGQR